MAEKGNENSCFLANLSTAIYNYTKNVEAQRIAPY